MFNDKTIEKEFEIFNQRLDAKIDAFQARINEAEAYSKTATEQEKEDILFKTHKLQDLLDVYKVNKSNWLRLSNKSQGSIDIDDKIKIARLATDMQEDFKKLQSLSRDLLSLLEDISTKNEYYP